MDLRTPWTGLTERRESEPAASAPGVTDPVATPKYSGVRRRGNVMRSVVVGLVLVIALLAVFGAVGHRSHAAVTDSSRGVGAPLAPVRGVPSGHGFALGRVVSNDGATLMVRVLLSGVTTVHADRSTRVLIPMNTSVAKLAVGSNIAVYGTRYTDGSLTAAFIVGGF